MRIIFMGTPEFASASLEAILNAGIEVAAVVTAPDKPVGRGQKIQQPDVKRCAIAYNLPVLQPEKLKAPDFAAQLQSYHADLFVVVAFRMLPEEVWGMPPLGTVNLHASLLPQYRGAAPINWAVINGETTSGTTVFFIEKEIDTGNILSYREEPISPDDNAGTLHDKLMASGAQHLVDAIRLIEQGNCQPVLQKTAGFLKPAPKIFKETCQINWNQDVMQVHNFIRGLSPCPAAWTTLVFPTGKRLTLKIFETEPTPDTILTAGTIKSDGKKCFQLAASNGWLSVKSLQLEGKKRMSTTDFLNGIHGIDECRVEEFDIEWKSLTFSKDKESFNARQVLNFGQRLTACWNMINCCDL